MHEKFIGDPDYGAICSFTFPPKWANWQRDASRTVKCSYKYAVLFFDFGTPPHVFENLPSAERLPRVEGGERVRYLSLDAH